MSLINMLIYSNISISDMKKMTCNIVILSSKMTWFFIYVTLHVNK